MYRYATCLIIALTCSVTFAQDEPAKKQDTPKVKAPTGKSLTEKASYLLGYNMVSELQAQKIDIDIEKVTQGLQDAAAGKKITMSDEEVLAVEQAFERMIIKKQQEMFKKLADDNMRSGDAFLKKNALEDGVKEFESGLQIKVLESGSGAIPKISDTVKIFYKGSFPDCTEIEATSDKPAAIPVKMGIPGMREALQKMKVGDKWVLFIPGNLGYGIQGRAPRIGPNQTLVFELELVEIVN